MPEEILALSIITLIMTTVLILGMTRMILRHRSESKGSKTGSGASMTTSELERMMRRVVEDATKPISRKLEDLEKQVSDGQGPRRLSAPDAENFLDLEEEEEEIDVEPIRSRIKSKS